jgi:hypothetical protein
MAVQYYQGQYYDIPDNSTVGNNWQQLIGHPQIGALAPKPIGAPTGQSQQPQGPNVFSDPFGTASSGGKQGTLQPYINRMTQNASNALYGGLLGYQPQSLVAGNAGGTPQNSQVPQWRLPSAIPTPNQGQVGLLGPQANNYQSIDMQQPVFGKRSWMEA